VADELLAERFEDPVARRTREELAQVALLCRIGTSSRSALKRISVRSQSNCTEPEKKYR
jgi:pilus assembly protein TadC